MPLTDHLSPLPHRPQRIIVAGTSGAGKTTLAKRLSALLDLPHTEIDALYHGPDWTPRAEFMADVEAFSAQDRWITEWQYRLARPLLAERADTLVWLDYPRHVVMSRVIRRTVGRSVRRERIFNGNVEGPLWEIFRDKEHIIRWAWDTHAKTARRVEQLLERDTHLVVVRLSSPRQAEQWLNGPLTDLMRGSG